MNIQPVAKSIIVDSKALEDNIDGLKVTINSIFKAGTVISVGYGVDTQSVPIEEGDTILFVGGKELPNRKIIVQERDVYGKITY